MAATGTFEREASRFRDPLPAVESGRYHLYVSWACPWAHRTALGRLVMGLEEAVGLSVVDPLRDERGWRFSGGQYVDPVNGFAFLGEAYEATRPGYDGRVTTPVLWDREERRVVNNESADILRMLVTDLAPLAAHPMELYPAERAGEIDALGDELYDGLNNAVYEAGFARSQEAYEDAARRVFATLDALERRLHGSRYLLGDAITEVDWRAFTTLVRFDVGYHYAFKCNLRKIDDYPALRGYLRELYQWPGIAGTVDLELIKYGYWFLADRHHIVARGPEIDLTTPHGREALPGRGVMQRTD
jgi:putative glutathione S-transferase